MASFNRVILLGNITRDPQLRYLPNQTPVVDFGLAMNRRFKGPNGEDREETTFVDCSAFARQAEIINQYCHKGSLLFIEGRLRYDTWEDKQGGGKRSKLSVVIENFQLMPRTGGQGGGGGAPAGGEEYDQSAPQQQRSAPRGRPGPQQQQPQAPDQPFPDEPQFKGDDIPF